MTTMMPVGVPTSGKPINLSQLQSELTQAGVTTTAGLGLSADYLYTYSAEGVPTDFPSAEQALVDSAMTAHVAMRNKTDAEYAAEFQDAATTAARKQEIRDIQSGLMPPEQVPITQQEWDLLRGTPA